MGLHTKMKTHVSKTAQRLEDEVESRPWHGWPGIIAWRWVGRANKLDINFIGHKLGASANMIYWFCSSVLSESAERPRARGSPRRAPRRGVDAAAPTLRDGTARAPPRHRRVNHAGS